MKMEATDLLTTLFSDATTVEHKHIRQALQSAVPLGFVLRVEGGGGVLCPPEEGEGEVTEGNRFDLQRSEFWRFRGIKYYEGIFVEGFLSRDKLKQLQAGEALDDVQDRMAYTQVALENYFNQEKLKGAVPVSNYVAVAQQ